MEIIPGKFSEAQPGIMTIQKLRQNFRIFRGCGQCNRDTKHGYGKRPIHSKPFPTIKKLSFVLSLIPLLSLGQGNAQTSVDSTNSNGSPKPKERDALDTVATVFAIIGNVAAGLGLYLVVKKERKTRNDVDKLKNIADEIKEQNTEIVKQNNLIRMQLRIDAKPDFDVFETKFKGDNCIVTIQNKGKKAFLLDFKPWVSSPLQWVNLDDYKVKRDIRTDEQFKLIGKTNDKSLASECNWDGTIEYLDSYQNKYKFLLGLHRGKTLCRQYYSTEKENRV